MSSSSLAYFSYSSSTLFASTSSSSTFSFIYTFVLFICLLLLLLSLYCFYTCHFTTSNFPLSARFLHPPHPPALPPHVLLPLPLQLTLTLPLPTNYLFIVSATSVTFSSFTPFSIFTHSSCSYTPPTPVPSIYLSPPSNDEYESKTIEYQPLLLVKEQKRKY